MTNYIIRPMTPAEYPLLDDFLYEAIFIPEGCTEEIPRDIIYKDPFMYAAIKDFGTLPDDHCLVAEADGQVVGAAWVRIAHEYGHMDDETPSLSISLRKHYRHQGIGTALIERMVAYLKGKGYKRASLGVSKENYAVWMYEKTGFRIVGDGANDTEYLMVCDLSL